MNALALLSWLLAATCCAFTPPANSGLQQLRRKTLRPLKAGGEAPQYDKIDAVLKHKESLGEGSVLLHVETKNQDTIKLDYQPGHVIALELEDTSGDDSKNEDTQKNGGWMRGPYTITRATENSLDVLIRVVGKKSRAFLGAPLNTPVRFGGKFKVPILEGIDVSRTKQVVLISTGVGVGPCVGAIEMALQKGNPAFSSVILLPSYRKRQEVVYQKYLDRLSNENPSIFQWEPIITSEMGRLSSSSENLNILKDKIKGFSNQDRHYHLIGNGEMVNEWIAGLKKAGVPDKQVSFEQYFNHKADVDNNVVDNIASVVSSACSVDAS